MIMCEYITALVENRLVNLRDILIFSSFHLSVSDIANGITSAAQSPQVGIRLIEIWKADLFFYLV